MLTFSQLTFCFRSWLHFVKTSFDSHGFPNLAAKRDLESTYSIDEESYYQGICHTCDKPMMSRRVNHCRPEELLSMDFLQQSNTAIVEMYLKATSPPTWCISTVSITILQCFSLVFIFLAQTQQLFGSSVHLRIMQLLYPLMSNVSNVSQYIQRSIQAVSN